MLGNKIYMTGSTDPWYVKPSDLGSPDAAMNVAFGAGGWTKYSGFTNSAIASTTAFLYIDGGYQTSTAFDSFVTNNIAALQSYVANGGVLVLNASRYDTAAQSLGFGGVMLNHGYSPSATAVVASSPIFNGPNGATGTNFTGGYFANDYLTAPVGSGFQTLINGTAGAVLGYEKYGTGMVVFGSMSDPKYDLPLAQAETLRANILDFADNAFVPTIVTATPATVEVGQTTIVGTVTAFQPGDALVLQETAGTGTLSLVSHNDGTYDVVYKAPGVIAASVVDQLSYTVTDTNHTATPNVASGMAAVQLDRGAVVNSLVANPGTVEVNQSIQIGTVTPGLPVDTLSVSTTAAGSVALSAVPVGGAYNVTYTAPSVVSVSGPDSFTFTVSDQHNDVKPVTASAVVLDAGPSLAQAQLDPTKATGTIEAGQSIVLGTVTAGFSTDALSVVYSATGGKVTLSPTTTVGTYNVVYTAATAKVNLADHVSYSVHDEYVDVNAAGTAIVQQDKGPTIGPAANFIVGHGLNYVVNLTDIAATPGLAGDVLKFTAGTATPGTEAVGANGTYVTYTALDGISAPTAAKFSYTVSDQYNDVVQTGTATGTIDPGPVAQNLTGSVTVGRSIVLGTVTPGLSVDQLSLQTTGAKGHLNLAADGTLTYVADGGTAYGTIPSLGSVTDAFTYTVTDQLHDTITKSVSVTVNNIINIINGPTYGGATTPGGLVGDDLVTLTGFSNNLVLYNGSDVVTGGDGGTTITKGVGDLTSHLRGFNNSVTAGSGNHNIDGSLGGLNVSLGAGANTISFDGFNNTITTTGPGNNVLYQTLAGGGNNITLGDGTQTVVIGGAQNTVKVGNNLGSGYSFINAGPGGNETVTAGDGRNYILAGGFNDHITVGNGTDVIFATNTTGSIANPPGTPASVPSTGVVNSGLATVTLGNLLGTASDNYVFLGGSSNLVFLGSSTGTHGNYIHGGTQLDTFVVAANGGNSTLFDFQVLGHDAIDVSKFFSMNDYASLGTHVSFANGTHAGEQILTLTNTAPLGPATAVLDLYGLGTSSQSDILSHLTYGH